MVYIAKGRCHFTQNPVLFTLGLCEDLIFHGWKRRIPRTAEECPSNGKRIEDKNRKELTTPHGMNRVQHVPRWMRLLYKIRDRVALLVHVTNHLQTTAFYWSHSPQHWPNQGVTYHIYFFILVSVSILFVAARPYDLNEKILWTFSHHFKHQKQRLCFLNSPTETLLPALINLRCTPNKGQHIFAELQKNKEWVPSAMKLSRYLVTVSIHLYTFLKLRWLDSSASGFENG